MQTKTAPLSRTGARCDAAADATTPPAGTRATALLLGGGVAAGPLFTVVAATQIFFRHGFHLSHHALSLLSLGDWGWIQIANFMASGVLSLACAFGMRRVLRGGKAGTWGAALIGVYGAALIAAGAFPTDPSEGFPPGTPDGMPKTWSWHGILHGIVSPIALLALVAACFVVARWFVRVGDRIWARYCALSGVLVIADMAWPDPSSLPIRMAIGSVLTFGWLTAVAVRLIAELSRSSSVR
jgi:hypothetical protein